MSKKLAHTLFELIFRFYETFNRNFIIIIYIKDTANQRTCFKFLLAIKI